MDSSTTANNDGNEINNPEDATAQVKGDEAAGNSDPATETTVEREQHTEETVTQSPVSGDSGSDSGSSSEG